MRCSKCGTNNPSTNNFCAKCGNALAKQCAKCKAENPPTSDFCGKCGARLTNGVGAAAATSSLPRAAADDVRVAPEPTVADPGALEGERKTVTALFADIKGSMELMEDLDPEEARAIVDPALKLMIDGAHRYDGKIVQSTGDGIFALFGAPVAHEDHPQRALYAALRMQEELKRYSDRIRSEGRIPIQVRVGVNTGEVVVRSIRTDEAHTEYTPIGHSISLAARMEALAPIGSIAATDQTRKLCEGYFTFKSLGPTKVKGVSEPVSVYEVTGLGPLRTRLQRSAARGLTKFVGRRREMDALRHALEQAEAGHGRIVAAIAEPGVGKSRLFYEFKAVSQSGCMVLETFSVSHGKASAYQPVIELLCNYFRIGDEDDDRSRREKVAGRLTILDPSLDDTRPYIFALLGITELAEPHRQWEQNLDRLDEYLKQLQKNDPLAQMDPQIQHRRTLDAIKRILLRESLNQPLMVIFEDLHWIDEQTQGFLNLLADSLGTAKVLLMVNYRPEYSHQWNGKTYYTQLRLDPLGRESAEEMLSALLGDGKDLAPLKRLIIERTEGTPFFMEEMVQALFEEGVLQRNGTVKLARSMSAVKVPATVQAVLASRIDRLPAQEKQLLQTLAVLGREFPLGLVRKVWQHPHPRGTALAQQGASAAPLALSREQAGEGESELERMLSHLQLGEFIYEQPAVGDVEYVFKHALTQEVAYNSVLIERRRLLHESTGRAIESLFAERLDEHLEALAHHYSRASNGQKAAHYLRLAGQRAAQQSAFTHAIAQFRAALELLRNLPADHERLREELATELALAGTLLSYQGYGVTMEVERSYLRAREIATQLDDKSALLEVLGGLTIFYRFRLEMEKSRALGEEFLGHARAYAPDSLGTAHSSLAQTLPFLGEFELARHHYEQARSSGKFIRTAVGANAQPVLLAVGARILWILGYPAQALELNRQAVDLARREGHAHPILVALFLWTDLHRWLRDRSTVLKGAEELLARADEQGMSYVSASATALRGWALADGGSTHEGLAEMHRSLGAFDQAGWRVRTLECAALAEMYGRAGEIEAGLDLIERALDQVAVIGERISEAELHRIKGELLLIENATNQREAEKCFRTAIEIAQRQKAKSWELRATTSLARLLAQQGRQSEAHAMLAEIYGWFTEGFDTADLKDAKAILDELSA